MLLGFISFPVLARVFSVSEYGTMSLVLKVILLLTVLGKFGLQNSVQRYYPEEGASPDASVQRRYYSTLIVGAGTVASLVALLFVTVLYFIPATVMSPNLRFLFGFVAVLILIRSLQPTLIGFLRAEGKTRTYIAVEIAVRAATVLLTCTLLLSWKRTLTVFFGSTISIETLGVLGLGIYIYYRGLLDFKGVDWRYFNKVVMFGFPLIGYELASVILDSGDRFLVRHYMGAQPLGYYSAAYNVSTYVEESLMVPINLALFPIYMRLWVEKGKVETQEFLSKSLNNFLALAVGVVCLVCLISRDVIVVLASRKYQEAHYLLPILVIGLLIYAVHIFLNAALLIHKKTVTMTALVFYACVLNVLLNIALIPRIGLQGAAIATLFSYLFLILAMGRMSLRLLPLQISYFGLVCNLAAAALTFAVIYPIQFHNVLANAAIKGTGAVLVYVLLVLLLNPVIRTEFRKTFRSPPKEAGPVRPSTCGELI
jgi:O-antigen/teichoic acid export membrane protein